MPHKLGDRVRVEGTIVGFGPSDLILCDLQSIKILPTPAKVGDTVWWDSDEKRPGYKYASPWYGATLIHIHQADGDTRKWAVIAIKGDIPHSLFFDQIRTTRECAD